MMPLHIDYYYTQIPTDEEIAEVIRVSLLERAEQIHDALEYGPLDIFVHIEHGP